MKDAYYFPHDSNAKDDPKIIQMFEQLGPEGYGIYWVLIETLRDQPNYTAPIAIIPGIARRYMTTLDKVRAVIYSYDLFEIIDDNFFASPSLFRRMEEIDQRRKKMSEAGKKGNLIRWESHSDNLAITTQSQVKKSKVKKSKENIYSCSLFEQAWEAYRRRGSKAVALTEWKKMSEDEKQTALQHIPKYVRSVSELKYQKHFERYLKTKLYESEVAQSSNVFRGAL